MKTKVFCVFEGGGARGVAHAGALRAIEDIDDYEVRGYAGTSAGAIVAALAAVGWTSNELITKHNDGKIESPALKRIGRGDVTALSQMFGTEWAKLQRFNGKDTSQGFGRAWFGKMKKRTLMLIVWLLSWPLIYHILRSISTSWSDPFRVGLELFVFAAWISYLMLGAYAVFQLFSVCNRFRGIATMEPVIEVLEKLFQAKVIPTGHRVTFSDIKKQKNCDLKIVAANIHSGSMVLFDAVGTPDVSVSHAVAASACIPIAFSPVEIDGKQYCDGGIVSNLPAWTFDGERLLDEECLVITCELPEVGVQRTDTESASALTGIPLFIRFAKTAVFGSSALNTRGLQNHISIPMEPNIGLLEFDRTSKHMRAIEDAEALASLKIDAYRFEQESLREVFAAVKAYLNKLEVHECKLRAALVREVNLVGRPPAAYKLWFSEGFKGYRDLSLLLPVDESLVGKSLQAESCRALDLTCAAELNEYFTLDPHTEGAEVLPRDRKWVVSVPIDRWAGGDRSGPPEHLSVAIALDGDVALPGGPHAHLSALRNIVDKAGVFTPY